MKNCTIGWDIGGAHLKAAVIYEQKIGVVYQQPCRLWRGLAELETAITLILEKLPYSESYQHAVTMTGELVDLFANRHEGVAQIITTLAKFLSPDKLFIFAGQAGLLKFELISPVHYEAIASANWLASATFAAKKITHGLLVDVGSTTTDILLLENGQVNARGYSDYARLISQELVYTGIIRTPVMALTQTVFDNGQRVGLMAEHFATMADVYRVTGELDELHDQSSTADGQEKTPLASAKRLSRMIGCDFEVESFARWQRLAANLRAEQLHRISQGCQQQLSRCVATENFTIIGAGVGRFLVKILATQLNCAYQDFSELLISSEKLDFQAADCAPAVAVALLLNQFE